MPDRGPPERTRTVREALREELLRGAATARDLSERVGVREKDVPGHLEHLDAVWLRYDATVDKPGTALVAVTGPASRGSALGRREAADRGFCARPAAEIDRADVEREPVARRDPAGLGGHRLGAAYGVVALLDPARHAAGFLGAQRNRLAVRSGHLERGGAALVRTGELRPSRGGQERRQTLRCAGMA